MRSGHATPIARQLDATCRMHNPGQPPRVAATAEDHRTLSDGSQTAVISPQSLRGAQMAAAQGCTTKLIDPTLPKGGPCSRSTMTGSLGERQTSVSRTSAKKLRSRRACSKWTACPRVARRSGFCVRGLVNAADDNTIEPSSFCQIIYWRDPQLKANIFGSTLLRLIQRRRARGRHC